MRVPCCCNGVAGLTVPLSVCTWWHWYSYNHFLIYCTWGNANILLQDALPTMGPMPLLLEECQIVNPTSFSLIVCTPSPLWLQLNCLSAKAWFFFFRWIVGSALCYLAAAQLCSVKNCSLQQCSLPCSWCLNADVLCGLFLSAIREHALVDLQSRCCVTLLSCAAHQFISITALV